MRPQTKIASMIGRGDRVVDEKTGAEAVVLRGPMISPKHTPGKVHFEVQTDDGRVWKARWSDTDRVEIR